MNKQVTTIDPERTYRCNASLSITEGAMVMIMSGLTAPFMGVYLLKMGGTDFHVAWLTALPPLVTIFCIFPANRYLAAQKNRYLPTVLVTAVLNRSFYLIFGFIPLIITRTEWQPLVFIFLLGLATIPNTLLGMSWTVMIGKLIPQTRRSKFFSWRNTITMGVSVLATMIGGRLLDLIHFPWNFTLLFGISFTALMISTLLLAFTIECDAEQNFEAISAPRQDKPVSGPPVENRRFQPQNIYLFYGCTFLIHLGINMLGPVLTIYHVKKLALTNTEIGWLVTIGSIAQMATFIVWGKIADRFGNLKVLCWVIGGLTVFSAGYLLSGNLGFLTVMNFLNGVFSAGFGLLIFNLLLEISPAQERVNTIAFYNLNANISSFLAPLAGTLLAQGGRFWIAFLVASLIRIFAAMVLYQIGRPIPPFWARKLPVNFLGHS